MSVTMALTNQIDGWTLRDSAISHVPLNFGPELASPALNQLIRAMWDYKSPPKGGYLQSHMAESFCRFFELKSFLFELYFFELYLFESSIGSMMINTISPGSRGSLAASRPATAALGPTARPSGCRGVPRFSHTAPAARRDCIYIYRCGEMSMLWDMDMMRYWRNALKITMSN